MYLDMLPCICIYISCNYQEIYMNYVVGPCDKGHESKKNRLHNMRHCLCHRYLKEDFRQEAMLQLSNPFYISVTPPSFHVIFHFVFHCIFYVILHYWGNVPRNSERASLRSELERLFLQVPAVGLLVTAEPLQNTIVLSIGTSQKGCQFWEFPNGTLLRLLFGDNTSTNYAR